MSTYNLRSTLKKMFNIPSIRGDMIDYLNFAVINTWIYIDFMKFLAIIWRLKLTKHKGKLYVTESQ